MSILIQAARLFQNKDTMLNAFNAQGVSSHIDVPQKNVQKYMDRLIERVSKECSPNSEKYIPVFTDAFREFQSDGAEKYLFAIIFNPATHQVSTRAFGFESLGQDNLGARITQYKNSYSADFPSEWHSVFVLDSQGRILSEATGQEGDIDESVIMKSLGDAIITMHSSKLPAGFAKPLSNIGHDKQ